ncbi:hypothetical protein KUL118_04530 [Tenacibaculum sp. KUL118]|nr:hypothetical protein KUL118_04530 [Tenacibaculum sp. KUL118]
MFTFCSFLALTIKVSKKKPVKINDNGLPDRNEKEVFCGLTVSIQSTAANATYGLENPKTIKMIIINV